MAFFLLLGILLFFPSSPSPISVQYCPVRDKEWVEVHSKFGVFSSFFFRGSFSPPLFFFSSEVRSLLKINHFHATRSVFFLFFFFPRRLPFLSLPSLSLPFSSISYASTVVEDKGRKGDSGEYRIPPPFFPLPSSFFLLYFSFFPLKHSTPEVMKMMWSGREKYVRRGSCAILLFSSRSFCYLSLFLFFFPLSFACLNEDRRDGGRERVRAGAPFFSLMLLFFSLSLDFLTCWICANIASMRGPILDVAFSFRPAPLPFPFFFCRGVRGRRINAMKRAEWMQFGGRFFLSLQESVPPSSPCPPSAFSVPVVKGKDVAEWPVFGFPFFFFPWIDSILFFFFGRLGRG